MTGSRGGPTRAHPHLYQVNARPWLHELGRRHGRTLGLADVPDAELDALAALGMDYLYLTGVWRRSALGRWLSRTGAQHFDSYRHVLPTWSIDDVIGSPFAVQAYVPDAAIGTAESLAAFRDRLAARGLSLILDFVPNHTGLDHAWVREEPDFYVQGTQEDFVGDPAAFWLVEGIDGGAHRFIARGRDPYFPAWEDTAQLNYSNPRLRAAMLATLRSIAELCDGVRCDMAMLVCNDVWTRTWGERAGPPPEGEFWPAAARENPDLLLIAEVYWGLEQQLQDMGFAYTYDKGLYDVLRAGTAADLRGRLSAASAEQERMVRFLENHDEERARAAFPDERRLRAASVLLATLPGLRFFHHGQLDGRRLHLPMRLVRTAPEPPDAALRAWYERLLHLADAPDFHTTAWAVAAVDEAGDDTAAGLVAYRWGRTRLVVVNFSDADAQGRVRLDDAPADGDVAFHDDLSGEVYRWAGEHLVDGVYVRLPPYGAHVFTLRPA